ncbi:hypothetical protein TNCV_1521681 [Trichonephila clavipes]|nr:hypothetical protein TNCV_1521681 [Trichonephila clavipes]
MLNGQRSSADTEGEATVHKWIRSQSESFFMDGMKTWISQGSLSEENEWNFVLYQDGLLAVLQSATWT